MSCEKYFLCIILYLTFVDNILANDEKKLTNTTTTVTINTIPGSDLKSSDETIENVSLSNIQDLITDEDVININNSAVESEIKGGGDEPDGGDDGSDNEGSESNDKGVKRTVNYAESNSRFTQPIVVSEGNLFTPADELPRKQINVQIIQPEAHNNGQYLKETVYLKEINSTTSSSTSVTTSTSTERGFRTGKAKSKVPSKYLAPIQAGLRLSNDGHKIDDDCDDTTEHIGTVLKTTPRQNTFIDIQKNTKIKKVTIEDAQPPAVVFGARFNVKQTTTPSPCGQPARCTPEINVKIISPPVTPQIFTPTTPKAIVTQQPVYIHTHTQVPVTRIVTKPVHVEKIVKQVIQVPVPVEVEKLVVQEVKVPVDRVVEKHINIDRPVHIPVEKVVEKLVHVPYAVTNIVDRPVPVEKIVTQQVHVPVDRIVEKIIDRPVEVPHIIDRPVEVQKFIEKHVPVPIDRIVERLVDRPVAVPIEKIVEKPIPYVVEKFIEKFIDRPIPVEVGVPVHVPVLFQVGVPVPQPYPIEVPVPYYIKPQPKHYYLIKTKHHKGLHNLFDFKHNNHYKSTKHVIIKHPTVIPEDIGYVPSTLGYNRPSLLPSIAPKYIPLDREPRYQVSADSYSHQAAASINLVHTALPNAYQAGFQTYFGPPPIQNSLLNFDGKQKYFSDSDFKDIRWEYGFKPPLIPSVEIDDFGNPKC